MLTTSVYGTNQNRVATADDVRSSLRAKFGSLPVHAQRLVEFLRPRTLVP
jgi:hypothetical protein